MSKIFSIMVLLLGLFFTVASAQDTGIGVGIIIGEPTGISGKLWLSKTTAIDGAAAWSLGNRDRFHLHADYLFHNFDLFRVTKGRLPLHFGVGGLIRTGKDDRIGIRGVVGITYFFENTPLDVFFELAPVLDLAPGTQFDLNAGIGARYYL